MEVCDYGFLSLNMSSNASHTGDHSPGKQTSSRRQSTTSNDLPHQQAESLTASTVSHDSTSVESSTSTITGHDQVAVNLPDQYRPTTLVLSPFKTKPFADRQTLHDTANAANNSTPAASRSEAGKSNLCQVHAFEH